MFTITKDWLDSNKTKSRGYSRSQLSILGIEWPPQKNWRKNVIGMQITDLQKQTYESLSGDIIHSTIPQVKRVFKKLNASDQIDFAHWAMSESSKC